MNDLNCLLMSRLHYHRIANPSRATIAMAGVLLLSLIIFALISFVNHRLFRTFCLDLGYYTQCMWDYAHGRINQSLIFENQPKPCLAAHFDLYLLIFSPLIYVFGSYTLLVLQIAFLLIGCVGMYKLLSLYTENQLVPILAALSFSLFFGVLHAVAFDYHSDVLIASALPWFFLFFKQKRYVVAGFVMLFILIGKENAGLLMIFVTIGLMWDVRKDRKALLVLCIYLVFSVLYSILILKAVMPALDKNSGQKVYGGLYRYKDWGYSFAEILKNILTHPLTALQALFNHDNKVEFFVCLLFSGALLGIGKPNYLLMLTPLIAQKMLTFDPALWGTGNQYNVIFAPIVITACFIIISKFSKPHFATIGSIVALFLVVVTSMYTIQRPKKIIQNKDPFPRTWIRRENIAFYNNIHYHQTKFPVKEAKRMMAMIPENASVCASTCFCPHLCFREKIHVFPHDRMFETEYVFVTQEYPEQDLTMFGNGYDTVAAARNITLLRKRP